MKFSIIVLAAGLMLTGCASETIPQKQAPCTGSLVKGCVPVVYFDTNSSEIVPGEQEHLTWGLNKMARWPEKKMIVTGYADKRGTDKYNLLLSRHRAQKVRDYYISKGIKPDRIYFIGRGKTDLTCDNPGCQEVDRRVEVNIYTPGFW